MTEIFDLLEYNPNDGLLRWKVGGNGRSIGSVAGWAHNKGYVAVEVAGMRLLAHRVAWLLATGSMPEKQIDHINGDKSDNRLANLRDVTSSENAQNKRKARSDNGVGLMGVRAMRKTWQARIMTNGKATCIGTFKTKEEAHSAYISAKREQHISGAL